MYAIAQSQFKGLDGAPVPYNKNLLDTLERSNSRLTSTLSAISGNKLF